MLFRSFVDPPAASDVASGLVPRFDGAESVLLATAMLGATVMPHAVYLHSGLTRDRHGRPEPGAPRRRLLQATRADVAVAMLLALSEAEQHVARGAGVAAAAFVRAAAAAVAEAAESTALAPAAVTESADFCACAAASATCSRPSFSTSFSRDDGAAVARAD